MHVKYSLYCDKSDSKETFKTMQMYVKYYGLFYAFALCICAYEQLFGIGAL